jgi:hypothetical protein
MSELDKYRIKVTDKDKYECPLILQGDKTILSRGNISGIMAKPKSFKTFLVSAITSAFLEDGRLTVRKGVKDGKVLHIDTEQSKGQVQKVQKRIYKMCEWDTYSSDDRLTTLSLRPLSHSDRLSVVCSAIEELRPDLVIIDGIRDLLEDINDLKSSSLVVNKLMEYSAVFDCGILCILHQNKSDNNARGHIGTELTNKSETVLFITKVSPSKGIVTCEYSRGESIDQFAFQINEESLPELCDIPRNDEKLRREVSSIMGDIKSMSKKLFIDQYIQATGKGESSAYSKLKTAVKCGIVFEENGIIIKSDNT